MGNHPKALLTSSMLIGGAVMLASFTPTPLFPEYRFLWGISDLGVSTIFAAYPAGVLSCLVLLGGFSDVAGRRRAILLGGVVMVSALAILAFAPSAGVMVLGRWLQGVGVALASTAGASALMELHPQGAAAGARLNTASISFGVAAGPLISGLLADSLPAPLVTPYLVVAFLVSVPVALALAAPATPMARGARLVRRISVPRSARRPFLACAAAVATTNVCTGLLGAFGPEVARSVGWSGTALSGVFVSVVLTTIAVAQLTGGRLPSVTAMIGGGVVAAAGWLLLAAGSTTASAPLALVGAVVLGMGAGTSLLGSAKSLAVWSPADRRAELYAAWLLVPFTALGASAFLAGPLLASTSLLVVLGSAAAVSATCTGVVVAASRERRVTT